MIDSIVLQINGISGFPRLKSALSKVRNGAWHYSRLSDDTGLNIDFLNDEAMAKINNIEAQDDYFTSGLSLVVSKPYINTDTGEVCNLPVGLSPIQTRSEYLNKDKFSERLGSKQGTYKLASGHYDIKYLLDEVKDTVSFSLSIPKFLYGTNIFQFVEPKNSPNHNKFIGYTWDWNAENTYSLLLRFIPYLYDVIFPIYTLTGFEYLSPSDVREKLLRHTTINRIDFCYNQIYGTEDAARESQKLMKFIRKKYARTGFMSNFTNDNILYTNSRVSHKIYHKGDEFRKTDRRHLLAVNRAAGRLYFNVENLQELADRTLRYEVTMHAKYLSYVHLRKVFRSQCPVHNYRKEFFNDAKVRIEAYNRDRETLENDLPANRKDEGLSREVISRLRASHKIKRIDFDFYKDYQTAYSKRCVFYPYPSKEIKHQHSNSPIKFFGRYSKKADAINDREDILHECVKDAPVTYKLIGLCIEHLKDFVLQYKLEEKPTFIDAEKRMIDYNEKMHAERRKYKALALSASSATVALEYEKKAKEYSPISAAPVRPLLLLLDKGMSFDEACHDLQISAQTKSNWKKTLSKIGYSTTALLEYADSNYNPELDFRSYHDYFKFNRVNPVYPFFTRKRTSYV